MRPDGRAELESLYFEYPRFEAPKIGGLEAATEMHQVVIVGAGPVGMTAALALASYGVRSILLERKSTFNDGSRAICISRQSFHILDRIGVIAPFLDKALGWRKGRSYYRGRLFYEFSMPHDEHEKFLPMYNLQQQYIEKFLWEAIAANPLIETRWQSEATSVAQSADGVAVTVRAPDGEYALHGKWLLAADGARSSVRTHAGLRLQGDNHEGRYLIADVRMDHDFPTIRRALFEPASNPGGTVLIHRQPDNIWRIDYQLAAGETTEVESKEARVRSRVGAILEEIGHRGGWDLEWWSVYSANTLCLDRYRHGRLLFVGDSAHIVPIFGVRGLNGGLADAHNIAWKLAYVCSGRADERLLDSYTPERRGATLDAFANATKSTRFMTPPTRGWSLMRDAALSLAVDHEFTRRLADPRQTAPYTYADSPLTYRSTEPGDSDAGNGIVGAVAPSVRIAPKRYLSDLFGPGFTVLVFGAQAAAALNARIHELRAVDPLLAVVTVGDDTSTSEIKASEHEIRTRYHATDGSIVLVRPDMHVSARCGGNDIDRLLAALEVALCPGEMR